MTLRRKISRDEISQTFNLKRLLGVDQVTEQQKELFYELASEKIVDRTLSGNDIAERKFKQYSKEYADLKGVSRDSVDMLFDGDMLEGIDQDNGSKPEMVKIKMSDDQVDKAYGHITGMKGHPTIKRGKVRDFFGFKKESDLDDIIKQVKETTTEEQPARQTQQPVQEEQESIDLVDLRREIERNINLDFSELE